MSIPAGQNYALTETAISPTPDTVRFQQNDGGNALLAAFAASATTNDFGLPYTTLTDTAGNTWNLIYSGSADNGLVGFNAIAVYCCQFALAFNGYNTLTMNGSFYPEDVLHKYAIGAAFQTNFSSLTLSAFGQVYINGQFLVPVHFAYDMPEVNANQLWFSGSFDAQESAVPSYQGGVIDLDDNQYFGTAVTGAALLATGTSKSQGFFLNAINTGIQGREYLVPVLCPGSSPDVFGFSILLDGSNSTGQGPNAQTLVFSINKGPEPIVPKEGRAIATVQIDCTQQVVTPWPIDYPEYSVYSDGSPSSVGAVVLEFDLEHLFQGAGLSEVRTLMAWSRPAFNFQNSPNREDTAYQGAGFTIPALLTNKVTLQTVMLGPQAAYNSGDSQSMGEYQIIPFPGNKNGLKYRFIAPQPVIGAPIGKFTLQFLNFEVMGAIAQIGEIIGFSGE